MTNPRTTTRSRRRELFIVIVVLAMMPVAGGWFLADYLSEEFARQAIVDVVTNSSGARLNGQRVDDPSVLLRTLRLARFVAPHHSHPMAGLRVDLVGDRETTAIVIARDSATASEFWVCRPGANWRGDRLGRRAGRVTSTELDDYLKRRGL